MNVKCCPICGEGMKKDCKDAEETLWFYYCNDCGFSEVPSILCERWEVQANTTHHGEQCWLRMQTCASLEEACKVVSEWDESGIITEVCEGRIWQKHLRIIRIEHALNWVHPENEKVGVK